MKLCLVEGGYHSTLLSLFAFLTFQKVFFQFFIRCLWQFTIEIHPAVHCRRIYFGDSHYFTVCHWRRSLRSTPISCRRVEKGLGRSLFRDGLGAFRLARTGSLLFVPPEIDEAISVFSTFCSRSRCHVAFDLLPFLAIAGRFTLGCSDDVASDS